MEAVTVSDDENDECSLAFYNKRSRVEYIEDDESIRFYFNYKNRNEENKAKSSLLGDEILNWRILRKMKQKERWGVVRHPMVLNFINERLIDCALFYTLHILAFGSFLLLLSAHIFAPNTWKNAAVTAFVFFFFGFMVFKVAVKVRLPENHCSLWFSIACMFNFLTYAATFLYVWAPTFFSYDNYHQDIKKLIIWLLPIIAIISAYINLLYVLRKSPYGIYIFMMVRILRSFGHIATIWIPTLIAFSFTFHLIMRDSGVEPWESIDKDTNSTMISKVFVILQAITKTSSMMVGELDANDILGTRQWIPSIVVLVFEIITVILLMNLMVSLAVGDVSDLRATAEEKLLKIKVNFIIEALQLSEYYTIPTIDGFYCPLFKRKTNNILVIKKGGKSLTFSADVHLNDLPEDPSTPIHNPSNQNHAYNISFLNQGMRVRIRPLRGRTQSVLFKNCELNMKETSDSGISLYQGKKIDLKEQEGFHWWWIRYSKWLIGLNWEGYIDL